MPRRHNPPLRSFLKKIRQWFVLPLVFVLSGCYLPLQFDITIEITRSGFFKMEIDGYLVSVPLYDGIAQGKFSPEKEAIEIAKAEKDLRRDVWMRELAYHQKGAFKFRYERTGDLLKSRMVTFLRRNERMISIKYLSDRGQILLQGTSIAKSKGKKLVEAGLNIYGRIRVITDAQVASHNADQVSEGKKKTTYTWIIEDIFDTSPRLTIAVP